MIDDRAWASGPQHVCQEEKSQELCNWLYLFLGLTISAPPWRPDRSPLAAKHSIMIDPSLQKVEGLHAPVRRTPTYWQSCSTSYGCYLAFCRPLVHSPLRLPPRHNAIHSPSAGQAAPLPSPLFSLCLTLRLTTSPSPRTLIMANTALFLSLSSSPSPPNSSSPCRMRTALRQGDRHRSWQPEVAVVPVMLPIQVSLIVSRISHPSPVLTTMYIREGNDFYFGYTSINPVQCSPFVFTQYSNGSIPPVTIIVSTPSITTIHPTTHAIET